MTYAHLDPPSDSPRLNRVRLLSLVFAFALGASAGLYYAWVVNPVRFIDTAPASLRADFQTDYLALVAAAYGAAGDLDRAQARLSLIPEPDPSARLAALAQQRLAAGFPESEAQALAALAAALGERPPPASSATSAAGTPTASPRPARTATLRPAATRTPTATQGAPFQLLDRERVCDRDLAPPLLMVEVEDAAGQPVPGIEVLVLWETGQDHFFTGLKPELGLGYGDFTMERGVNYAVNLADLLQSVTGISAQDCAAADGSTFPGSWRLVFAQP